MENLIFTPVSPDELIIQIADAVITRMREEVPAQTESEKEAGSPIDDYIPKSEIRGKLASSSTLWQWEKSGKLQSYGIGGKRYYKREDIEALFKPINH